MNYIDRQKWGAKPPKWNPGPVKKSQGVFIHYNGPPVSPAVTAGDYESVAAFLRSTQNYHMNSNGWPDIAYSWCVDSVGRIWELRGWGTAGAHTLNWNWESHAIFLPLGGNQAPTTEQVAACKIVVAEHNRRYGAGFVKGHQDAPNSTSCPGPAVLPMVRRGDFNPTPQQQQIVNQPKGETAMSQIMMRTANGTISLYFSYPETVIHEHPNGTLWIMYPGTPIRQKLRREDAAAFKFMGVKTLKLDRKQADFFLRYSREDKPARIHVKTPADAATFSFLGVKQIQIDAQQETFFNRYYKPVA